MSRRIAVISDLEEDVKKKAGPGFELVESSNLTDFPMRHMAAYPYWDGEVNRAANHCSLASVTAVLLYYRRWGLTGIPAEGADIFRAIYQDSRSNFFYHPWVGTPPFYIPWILKRAFARYDYRIWARNQYFFKNGQAVFDRIQEDIDRDRPLILNFYSGAYRRHSVSCMGYRHLTRGQEHRYYALVADNWSDQVRYVDLTYLGSQSPNLFAMTRLALAR